MKVRMRQTTLVLLTYEYSHLKPLCQEEFEDANQNPYIEEEQTTQWPKEEVQKDKQLSTKHTYKTKDRVTRTPLKQTMIYKTYI